MADDLQMLDLLHPGKLWVSAEHFSKVTFHLVVPKDNYTKEDLTKNPQIDPNDDLMPPYTAPSSAKNGDGVIELNLIDNAEVICERLNTLQASGKKVEKARLVVLAYAEDGNKIPDQQTAECTDFTVKYPIPIVKLAVTGDQDPTRSYVTVPGFKSGQSAFVAQLTASGVTEVNIQLAPYGSVFLVEDTPAGVVAKLKASPALKKVQDLQAQLAQAIAQRHAREEQASGGPYGASYGDFGGRGDMLNNEANIRTQINTETMNQAKEALGGSPVTGNVAVKDGGTYTLVIPVPFQLSSQSEQVSERRPYLYYYVNGVFQKEDPNHPFSEAQKAQGWRSAGNGDFVVQTLSRDIWTGGDFVLTVTGTGEAAGVKASVKLRAESWGSDWMNNFPPAPFAHNAC